MLFLECERFLEKDVQFLCFFSPLEVLKEQVLFQKRFEKRLGIRQLNLQVKDVVCCGSGCCRPRSSERCRFCGSQRAQVSDPPVPWLQSAFPWSNHHRIIKYWTAYPIECCQRGIWRIQAIQRCHMNVFKKAMVPQSCLWDECAG